MASECECPLSFQQVIFEQTVNTTNALIVLARGLGLSFVLSQLLRVYCAPEVLVFIVNATEEDLMTFANLEYFHVINANTPPAVRAEKYLYGGVFAITNVVLLSDLLLERIPAHMVTGLLILHAEQISELGLEVFSVSLLRQTNSVAFVKAFSDRADQLAANSKLRVERLCRWLMISELILFPRIESRVDTDLRKNLDGRIQLQEIDLKAPLLMRQAHVALYSLLEIILRELIKSAGAGRLDPETETVEAALMSSFDVRMTRILAPSWHLLGAKCKQLLGEIGVVRQLLDRLVRWDAVGMMRVIDQLVMADAEASANDPNLKSYWLQSDEAHVAMMALEQRLHSQRTFDTNSNSSKKRRSVVGMERLGKFEQLELHIQNQTPDFCFVMVQDRYVARMLLEIMTLGSQELWLELQLQRYLKWRASHGLSIAKLTEQIGKDEEASFDLIDDELLSEDWDTSMMASFNGVPVQVLVYNDRDEYSLLWESLPEDQSASIILYDYDLGFVRSLEVYFASYTCARRKQKVDVVKLSMAETVEEQVELWMRRQEKDAFENLFGLRGTLPVQMQPLAITEALDESVDVVSRRLDYTGAQSVLFDDDADGEGDGSVVQEKIKQRVVVDVRELRSSLPFVLYQRGFQLVPRTIEVGDYILTPDLCVERKSIGDLLASLYNGRLYQQVERMKTFYKVPILLLEFDRDKPFSLLASVEYTRATTTAYYTSTSSSSARSTSRDGKALLDPSNVLGRICQLLLHHPNLRIIWSSSQQATSAIFLDLKRQQEQPAIPNDEEEEASSDVDPTAIDMLKAMPGVNAGNLQMLVSQVRDLVDLAQRSMEDLQRIIGTDNGFLLYEFLHT